MKVTLVCLALTVIVGLVHSAAVPTKEPPAELCQQIFYCFVPPCMFAKCEGVMNATCVSNYCGGCNAYWYVDDVDVSEKCSAAVES